MNLHEPIFEAQFSSIGLSQADYAAFKSATQDANTAWSQWQAAKDAYTTASNNWRQVKKATRTVATSDVKKIRTFALEQADPNKVFGLAAIPAPKTPNFGVPPGTPTSANVTLDVNTGNLEVRFECNNPPGLSGTVYLVQRRTASASAPTVFSAWTQAAVTSVKRFIDSTITSGTASVQYIITAQRGTIQGRPSTPITVQFGRAGNGPGMTVTVGEDGLVTPIPTGKPKLAA
jgi:hypothetical protein